MFFSVILLFLFLSGVFIYFNTSSYILINYFLTISNNFVYNNINFNIFFIFFFIGYFFKLGLAPIQYYKIEVYENLNFITIFLYTVYFFLFFLFFFMYIFFFYINYIINSNILIILLSLVVLSIYLLSILFDVDHIKSFLAISSITNSFIYLIIFILIGITN